MPSKSAAQARLMLAAAHDSKVAKRAGIPQRVAREFVAADKGKKVPWGAMLKGRKGKG